MAKVHDVVAYILDKQGKITAMKLQKLLYYSQAWSLVWDEKPLFSARIEAWANGPVVRAVYDEHKGKFQVGRDWPKGDPKGLDDVERETVDAVLGYYGDKSSQWLSDLTHQEDPWRLARAGALPGQRSENEITHEAMAEYYSSLVSPQV